MPAGLHIVKKTRAGKPALWYVYAWRGGPRIYSCEGQRPRITGEIIDAAGEARRELHSAPKDTLHELIDAFKESADWSKLAKSTRANWETWFPRIIEAFGDAPLEALNDRRMRG